VRRTPFADWPCSIARAVDLLGDWWTPLVLRECFYGVRRFDDFQRSLGIGRNILTQRLNRLVDEGLLERRQYHDRPVRHEYVLTDKGRDFFPVIAALVRWGDRWLAGEEGPPVVLQHRGHDLEADVVCSQCGEPVRLRDVTSRIGPGYPERRRPAAMATGRFTGAGD
jgi:DNA-binding HxlR family transcriptional regulator